MSTAAYYQRNMPRATLQLSLIPEGGIEEIIENNGFSQTPRASWIFMIFQRILDSRRHPRDFPEPLGSILGAFWNFQSRQSPLTLPPTAFCLRRLAF